MDCLTPGTMVVLAIIISITILELVAMIVLGLDGVALSATVATLTSIALKRQEIEYKLRSVGAWKSRIGTSKPL